MHRKDTTALPGNPISVAASNDTATALLRLEQLFPDYAESSSITIECHKRNYSASLIARAVEDCDACLLNLNVTSPSDSPDGRVAVELRVNHREPDSVSRSLERYGFEVVKASGNTSGATDDDSLMRRRYDELMHYLNI